MVLKSPNRVISSFCGFILWNTERNVICILSHGNPCMTELRSSTFYGYRKPTRMDISGLWPFIFIELFKFENNTTKPH